MLRMGADHRYRYRYRGRNRSRHRLLQFGGLARPIAIATAIAIPIPTPKSVGSCCYFRNSFSRAGAHSMTDEKVMLRMGADHRYLYRGRNRIRGRHRLLQFGRAARPIATAIAIPIPTPKSVGSCCCFRNSFSRAGAHSMTDEKVMLRIGADHRYRYRGRNRHRLLQFGRSARPIVTAIAIPIPTPKSVGSCCCFRSSFSRAGARPATHENGRLLLQICSLARDRFWARSEADHNHDIRGVGFFEQ
jgi:hypothetical protein